MRASGLTLHHKLIGLTIFLILIGLILQFSLSPTFFYTQLVFVALGLLAMWLFSRIELSWYQYFWRQIYIVLVGLLGLTLALGVSVRGSSRWIELGAFRFQPSEIAKPFLVVLLASWLVTSKSVSDRAKAVVLAGIPLLMIFLQPDLGTALVLATTIGVTLLVYEPSRKMAIGLILIGLVVSPLLLNQLETYQKERLLSFSDPYADPLGSGYNVLQAQLAIGSGKLVGKGLGTGTQSHLNFLPEKHTDFAFASVSEEVGFVGSSLIVASLFGWLAVMWFMARSSPVRYNRLVILGLLTLLMVQTFINLGMNMGLLPVTGLTLPWLSAGGSSIISVGVTLGIMVAAYTRVSKV